MSIKTLRSAVRGIGGERKQRRSGLKSAHNVRSAHDIKPISIVGESYFQDAIARCSVGQSVALITEPGNPINPCAIMVWNQEGHQIGYLPLGSWVAGAMPPRGYTLYALITSIHGEPPKRTVILDWFYQRTGRLFE
ncbi:MULTISPECIES: HIRAN domain-containing protein [Sphingobium]|jgi:hypothetical protein|nr:MULTISPECIES: HIRAN domain-containing protein [Sphingobium]